MKNFTGQTVFFLTVIAVIAIAVPAQSYAQMSLKPSFVSAGSSQAAQVAPEQKSMPIDNDEEITVIKDEYAGKYNASTLENLSRLYWRLGAFDFDDETAIGNYLKINDCKIYTEYLNDDLEWKEIIKTMKQHLRNDNAGFPLNYQFVLQLHLGRYDMERGGFPIIDRTGFDKSQRIEVDSIDYNRQICFDQNAIKDYPKSVMILLSKPFTFDFVKLNEHVAQAYILRKKSEYEHMDPAAKINAYERDAYLRLRVTFSQYHGNLKGQNGNNLAILYGNIDGYEIFEDSGQQRLMKSVNLLDTNATEPQISEPVEIFIDNSAGSTAPTTDQQGSASVH